MSPADELRAAATRLEKAAASHDGDKVDVWAFAAEWMDPWVQLMSPALAAPLVSWLRDAAERAEVFAKAHVWDIAQGNAHSDALRPALTFARVINGTTS